MSALPSLPEMPPTWRAALDPFDPGLRRRVAATVQAASQHLSDRFYVQMQADPQAGAMLDHAVVNQRLHASMIRWLHDLFEPDTPLDRTLAQQQRTGEVHARIGVPMDLVNSGARLLKREIVALLSGGSLPRAQLADAIQYVYELVDLALDTMNKAYATNVNRLVRSDEAYRLFFLNQDMKAERDRQKSQLLEWAHQILVSGYWAVEGAPASAAELARPPFGLWLQHKASILFEGAPELARIQACMASIESVWLPQLGRARHSHDDAREVVAQMNRLIEEIKQLMGSMFDRYIETTDGRDSVTRLLNRRYFPAVAKREIELAQRQQSAFALLGIEIDGFDALRGALGLDGSDTVLAGVAEGLLDSVRAGDFVFRVGDARFLVLLVETSVDALPQVADGLRRQVESLRLRTASRASPSVTVSIGAALFDGHPDYQRLLDRADAALKAALASGANRCVVDA